MRKSKLFGLAAGMMFMTSFAAAAQDPTYVLDPAPGVATDLMTITVEWPGVQVEFYENNRMPSVVLENNTTGATYVCESPLKVAEPRTSKYSMTFIRQGEDVAEPITTPGDYTLSIKAMYQVVDGDPVDLGMITANYTIEYSTPYTLTPAPGVATDLQNITLNFGRDMVDFYENNRMPAAVLTNKTTNTDYVCETPLRNPRATEGVCEYTLTFVDEDGDAPQAINFPGEYELSIRAMYTVDAEGNMMDDLAPINVFYTVNYPTAYVLNPASGETVTDLMTIDIDFPESKTVAFYENNRMPAAVLVNKTTGREYVCETPMLDTRANTTGKAYTMTFANAFDDEVGPINEPGYYELTIKALYDENGDLPMINANYFISYPVMYNLNPASGAFVEDLMRVTLQFDGKVGFYENNRMPAAVLENTTTGKTYNCELPILNPRAETDGCEYILTFIGEDDEAMPITEPGHYTMTVRAFGLINEDGEIVTDLPAINAEYNIAFPVEFVLDPDNGAFVEDLMKVTIEFPNNKNVALYENNRMPSAVLENVANGKTYVAEPMLATKGMTEGALYEMTFISVDEDEAMPITEPGKYNMTLRGFYLMAENEDDNVDLPVINATYNVTYPVEFVLTPDNGANVVDLQKVSIEFPNNKNVAVYENNRMPAAVLENTTTGKTYVAEPIRNTRAMSDGAVYDMTFISVDDEESMPITEPGKYTLTLRAFYLEDENGEPETDLPVINAEYGIPFPINYWLNPDNGASVENLQGITILFPDNKNVAYYENMRIPVAVLENTTTGKVWNCQEPDRNTRATEGSEFTFTFIGENDEEAMPITEPGQYVFTLRAMYLEGETEDDNVDLPVIVANYTVPFPVQYYLFPDNGASVENLQGITIQFPDNNNVAYYENMRIPVAVLENTTTGHIWNCQEPDRNTRATEGTEYTFTFIGEDDEEAMPITEPGQYVFTVRAMYLEGETEDDNVDLPVIVANYTVPFPVEYYLFPDNGASVEDLMSVTVQFPNNKNVAVYENNRMPVAVLENTTTGKIYNCETPARNTRVEQGSEYTFVFINSDEDEAMPITEPGQYVMTIRALYLEGEDGQPESDLPVIVANYTIEYPVAYILTPDNGANVEDLMQVTIEFPENKNVALYENNRMPVAVLENMTTGNIYEAQPIRNTRAMSEGAVYEMTFISVDNEDAMPITEPGQYTMTLRGFYLESEDEDDNVDLPVIVANYNIPYPVEYILTPDNGANVEDLMVINIEFPTSTAVQFYENMQVPVAVLVNNTTGAEYYCMEADRDVRAMTEGVAYNLVFIADGAEEAEPITEIGKYSLTIRGLALVNDGEFTSLPVINANYTIPYPVEYILNPEDGAQVENLKTIYLEFPTRKVAFYENMGIPVAVLVNNVTGAEYYCQEADRDVRAMTDGTAWTLNFMAEDAEELADITELGSYTLTIRGLGVVAVDENEVETLEALPVITANYTIGYPAIYILNPEDGAVVESLDVVELDFPYNTNIAFYENLQMPVAVLVNNTTGNEYVCLEADRNTFAETDGVAYTLHFMNAETEEYETIAEDGVYTLTIRALGFVNEEGEFVADFPVINATYTIVTSGVEAVEAIGEADVYNVYNVNGIQLVKNGTAADVKGLGAGLYIINGKKVLIRK